MHTHRADHRRLVRGLIRRVGPRSGLRLAAAGLVMGLATVSVAVLRAPVAGAATPATTWTQMSPATSPSGRQFASMAYDPGTGQMVLFGGLDNGLNILNDTWTWDGSTWTQQSPATSPSPRYGASMAYDPGTGQMVLFGGFGSNRLNDTWTWDGSTWTQHSPATSPPARNGPSLAYDPGTGQLVLFGGDGNSGLLGDTWTWDGSTWTPRSPATSPSPRYGPSLVYDPGTGQMVLFGGSDNSGFLGDTWTWDGSTWTQLSPATSPPERQSASLVYDPGTGQLVLFGGSGNSGFLGDTWTYGYPPGTAYGWTGLSPATSPPAHYGASLAYDPGTGQMVFFGGRNNGGFLNDTWTWDGSTWTQLSPATSPPGRDVASMAYDPGTGQLLLFGGLDSNGFLNDTWTWDGSTWTQLSPATSPSARLGASLAYDQGTGQMVLIGGFDGSNRLNDTWTWDGSTWTPQSPATSPSARDVASLAYDPGTAQLVLFGGFDGSNRLNDTWTWDGSTWTPQSPATSPSARDVASLAYDPGTGQLLLFGGSNGALNDLNDTWTWSGSTWTQLSPATSPPARYGASTAYDPGTGQLVLFGGSGNGAFLNDTWAYQPVAVVVAPSSFTTSLTSPPSTAVGNAWNDAATVTGNPAGGAPSGSVTFTLCQEASPPTACTGGTTVDTISPTGTSGDVSTFTLPGADAQSPTAAGTYCYNVSYSATAGGNYLSVSSQSDDECFTVTMTLAPGSVSNGTWETPYPTTTFSTTGATGTVTFSETGALPQGLSLSSAGVLSGTPTAKSQIGTTFGFTVKATDAALNTVSGNYSIEILSPCAAGLTPYFLSATSHTGNFTGIFCVNTFGTGTYTQSGGAHGSGTVTSSSGVTHITAFGTNLALLGQKTTTSSTFTETAPAPMKAGTFTLL